MLYELKLSAVAAPDELAPTDATPGVFYYTYTYHSVLSQDALLLVHKSTHNACVWQLQQWSRLQVITATQQCSDPTKNEEWQKQRLQGVQKYASNRHHSFRSKLQVSAKRENTAKK